MLNETLPELAPPHTIKFKLMRFRILTRKSRLNFGQYPTHTVAELLDILHKTDRIIWYYYNMSHISFHEDILNELNLERITKPGIDPELGELQLEKRHKQWHDKTKECIKKGDWAEYRKRVTIPHNHKVKSTKRFAKSSEYENSSKAALQAKNHGKKL